MKITARMTCVNVQVIATLVNLCFSALFREVVDHLLSWPVKGPRLCAREARCICIDFYHIHLQLFQCWCLMCREKAAV